MGRSPRGPRAALQRLRGVYSPTHYYVRVSRAASFTGVCLLHRHRAFSKTQQLHRHSPSSRAPGLSKMQWLHRHSPSSQAPGLLQNTATSQAFAFFTSTGPFPKHSYFTGIELLHRHQAFFRGKTFGDVGCSTRSGWVLILGSPSARSRAWKHEQP